MLNLLIVYQIGTIVKSYFQSRLKFSELNFVVVLIPLNLILAINQTSDSNNKFLDLMYIEYSLLLITIINLWKNNLNLIMLLSSLIIFLVINKISIIYILFAIFLSINNFMINNKKKINIYHHKALNDILKYINLSICSLLVINVVYLKYSFEILIKCSIFISNILIIHLFQLFLLINNEIKVFKIGKYISSYFFPILDKLYY